MKQDNIEYVELGEVITRSKEETKIQDNKIYKQVTIRLWNKGVIQRNEVAGSEIAAKKRHVVRPNQFIISKIDARNGAFGLIPESLDGAVVSSDFLSFNVDKKRLLPKFLEWISKTSFFLERCIKASSGTTNRVRLNEKKFLSIEIPIPSLGQQEKIIERLEEMVVRNSQIIRYQSESFELVSDLRKRILQEAVQGKLVLQDENDESAFELLKKIHAEKEKLVAEKKIKKSKPLAPIKAEEAPYELPDGWQWVRLPEIGELARGKSKHRPRNDAILFKDGKYPLIQTGDVARSKGKITTFSSMYNDVGLAQSRLWPKGTLCITIAANIADTGILNIEACFPDSVVGFVPSSLIGDARYFEYFFRVSKENLVEYAPSTAQKNINLGILESLMIPLPPINEQKRIVAKVDELMQLCDELEAQIEQSKKDSELLMQAVLQEAFQFQDEKIKNLTTVS